MSKKSLAQSAVRPAVQPALIALAMGLSVAAVALTPQAAYAGGKGGSNGAPNSNAGGNGHAGSGGASGGGPTIVTLPDCAAGDLTPGAAACSGFFQGNLLSNNASDLSAQTAGLTAIGLANWDGKILEPQLDLTSSIVNFATALNGLTWIGVHFGAGSDGPSPQTPGGVTAFYRFDAGTNLDTFLLSFGAASAARLYATEPVPTILPPTPTNPSPADGTVAVPEPAAWALMILGFGAAGAMLRRRRAIAAA